jgi:hypothetical protein
LAVPPEDEDALVGAAVADPAVCSGVGAVVGAVVGFGAAVGAVVEDPAVGAGVGAVVAAVVAAGTRTVCCTTTV